MTEHIVLPEEIKIIEQIRPWVEFSIGTAWWTHLKFHDSTVGSGNRLEQVVIVAFFVVVSSPSKKLSFFALCHAFIPCVASLAMFHQEVEDVVDHSEVINGFSKDFVIVVLKVGLHDAKLGIHIVLVSGYNKVAPSVNLIPIFCCERSAPSDSVFRSKILASMMPRENMSSLF